MTLGFIAAYFFKAAFWKRLIVFLSSIPITVAMNSLRIGLDRRLGRVLGPAHGRGRAARLRGLGGVHGERRADAARDRAALAHRSRPAAVAPGVRRGAAAAGAARCEASCGGRCRAASSRRSSCWWPRPRWRSCCPSGRTPCRRGASSWTSR